MGAALDDPRHDREIGSRHSTRDTTRIDDLRIEAVRPLVTPALLHEALPITDAALETVERTRREVLAIIEGKDDRLLMIVGPCSIHAHDEAVEYASLLRQAAVDLADELCIVMRCYFEKPRTTVGWKGYINDPHLDGSFAINVGLERARRLLLDILELDLPVATEFLDLLSPQFVSDLVTWGAIGARTTESQTHRQLASGLSCPVGFKNGTDGNVRIAVDAVISARSPHAFIGMTKMGQAAVFETRGNPHCHVILRGGKSPNYDAESIEAAGRLLSAAGLPPRVMVDASHANSAKQHRNQIAVVHDLAQRIADGEPKVLGIMLESHLEEGRQDLIPGQPLRRGVSITDACLAWADTRPLLERLAQAVRAQRHGR